MLIDWFTVGAQALNFIILVWLMKRFLYKPILRAIDAREKKVHAELADADKKKDEAKKERDEFQRKNEELDQQRAALLKKATDEASGERERLLGEARSAADAFSARRKETLTSEAENLSLAVGRRIQEEVFAIARKALTDLVTTSLEERVGEVFTRRLRELSGPAKASLAKALASASSSALVRSAFELEGKVRATIQNAVNETFSADVHLRFETSPDVVCGIELTMGGERVGWSVADYLASLQRSVGELLKEPNAIKGKAATKMEPKPEPKPSTKLEPKREEPKHEANERHAP
jgi:F-type H+-transporting ATPase subunit b